MANEKELRQAQIAYKAVCKALDGMGWHYTQHEDDLVVTFGVQGDDLPMDLLIACDADRQLIRLLSKLPFQMSEDKRVDGAIATCHATYRLADGSFDYDLSDGSIMFRMTSSFRESLIGTELLTYMINCASYTIDVYNDQFLMLNKGVLSISEFLKNNQ